jgi:dTDP-4-dehydrorhamnose reductase
LSVWLLKVNWCVIQLSVVIRSSGYAFVQQVIELLQQHEDYLIVGRDAVLYTTVVEEPATFVYR